MALETKYDPKKVEKNIYAFWVNNNYFSSTPDPTKKSFCIVIPPPNITGILHMGHALNNTIQDVLIRFKRMQGYKVLWMPGTDHAGIATQNVVEKMLAKDGLTKEEIGRERFLNLLWEWTDKYGSTIIEQLKRLGASCDWERTRFTMDQAYSEAVKEVFVRLYKDGLIYRGKYIINWCPRCKTALSDEEAPYKEIEGFLYYIKYPVIKKKGEENNFPDYVVVATTRPETMLGDTALAFHPNDARYKWLKEKNIEVILPIVGRKLKIIEDISIDPDFGTGLVKVTPAHDPADFILGKKYDLEFINIMNDDGTLNRETGRFSGMDRFKARDEILKELESKGLLVKKTPHIIKAGHCYRCGTLIEPRLSLQWFVRMKPLAEPAIDVVEKDTIKFFPSRWKKVYLNWMYNIQDWCISRQIWWGHRIPVWYCLDCRKDIEDESENKGIIVDKEKPKECPFCKSTNIVQDEDVLDTWFSSWLWPFATFYWPFKDEKSKKIFEYFYPTSVLVTASEILFFWVARMIMAGLKFIGKIPFYDVLIHGTVRDEKGIKMSKSLGNIIDPLEIIDKFGADSLRFSLMLLCSTGSDVYLSDEKFLVGRNFTNKIWNATRFILMKIEEENIKISSFDFDDLDIPGKWILNLLNETIEKVTKYYENYRINEAVKEAYDFFWHQFCDWYLEIAKYTFHKKSTLPVLLYCLINSLKLLHPVMPFITEHIFSLVKQYTDLNLEEAIIISSWPKKIKIELSDKEKKMIEEIKKIIKYVRDLKSNLGIASAKIGAHLKTKDNLYKKFLEENVSWIERLANLEKIEFKMELKRAVVKEKFLELDLLISNVDKNRFQNTLNKRKQELQKRIENIRFKLQNKDFLTKAPQQIVNQHKEKLQQLQEQFEKLHQLEFIFQ